MPKLSMRLPKDAPMNKKIARMLFQLAFVLIIIFVIYYLLHKNKPSDSNSFKPQTINQLESNLSKEDQGNLKKGDYATYQGTQSLLAKHYITAGDTADADRLMSTVFEKVPKDKINSQTYYVMVSLSESKKDNEALKKYLRLLIAQLKTDGETKGAAAEQKYLDSIK